MKKDSGSKKNRQKEEISIGKRYGGRKCELRKRARADRYPLGNAKLECIQLDLFVVDPQTQLPIGRPSLSSTTENGDDRNGDIELLREARKGAS